MTVLLIVVAAILMNLAWCICIGKAIKAGTALPVCEPVEHQDVQYELDDWLVDDELPFDFKVWKQPVASTKNGAAGLSIPDATTHGGHIHE